MKPNEIKVTVKNNFSAGKSTSLRPGRLSLSVEQKACLFMLLMGGIGAAVGSVQSEVSARGCSQPGQCMVADASQKRLNDIESNAFAGMGAAFFLSLPALIKQLSN
jgi:hypothetical protein